MAGDTEKRISVKTVLDSSGFSSSIKGINAELKNAQSQFKLASSGIQAFGKDSEKLKSVQEALARQTELQAKKVDTYRQAMEKTHSKMEENIKTRDKLKASLEQANKKYDEAVKAYGKESTEANKAKESVDKLTQEYKKSENAIESNAKKIQTYSTNVNKASAELNKIQGELNKVTHELKEQDNKWLSASKGLKEHGEHLQNIGDKANSTGNKILGMTAPIVAVGGIAMKVGMDYEAQMSRVKAISGATTSEFKQLNDSALDLGASTAFSAKEVAQAQEMMASAGFKVNEILDAQAGVLDLSASSGEDLATSATIASGAIRGFGLEASKSAHVADVLAKASADTNAGVSSMGEAFKYVAPLAKSVGWDIESVASAVGAMADANIDGSTSGTTLRGVISRLANPSKESAGAMEKLGFNAFDANGKMKPLSTVVDELGKSMNGLTDQQKQENISTILGQEAMSGFMVLMQKGKPALDNLAEGFRKSDGCAKEMATIMQDNAKSSIDQAIGSLETASIKLEQQFAPTIKSVADIVGKFADVLGNLPAPVKEAGADILALSIATGGLLKVGGLIFGGVGKILGLAGKLAGAVGAVGSATAGATTATAGATTALAGATTATAGATTAGLGFASIFNPITAGIAIVCAGIYTYKENTELMGESCIKSGEDLGVMDTLLGGLNGNLMYSKEKMHELNIEHKEFSKDVSKETAESLKQCSSRIAEFNAQLKGGSNIKDFITSADGQALNQKLEEICNSAIQKIESKSPEMQKKLADSFKADDNTLDKNEQTILNYLNKSKDEQIKKVQEIKKQILDLEKQSGQQQGEEKKKTLDKIAKLTEDIGKIELNNTVKSQKELQEAQANFNARMEQLDIKGTGKLLEEKAKLRKDETDKIKVNYNEQIELLKMNRDKMNDEEKKACDAEIKILEGKRDSEVKTEDDKYKSFLQSAMEKYPEITNFIDLETGKQLTNAQQKNKLQLDDYMGHMENMAGITTTGYYQIKDTTTGKMHECYVEVNSATGQIVGAWDSSTKKIIGNPVKAKEEIDQELKNGAKFQPVVTSWDAKKQEIWNNSVKVQSQQDWNLFDWVKPAYNGIKSWVEEHPIIASVVQGAMGVTGRKWTGDNHFKGGLTYLHDSPSNSTNYELYDLPQGTRIFNHDASADLVMQSAKNVAQEVAQSVMKSFKGLGNTGQQEIIIPVNLDGKEIARVTARPMSEELNRLNRRGRLGYV